MDPLTHYLSAKLTSHLFIKERADKLISLFILASIFPDIDYITRIFGRATYLKYHRGITHSFVGIVILSALLAFLFERSDKKLFFQMFGLAFISMLIHILLDWTNAYGTQLFLPFSSERAALDAIPILDIYILITFAIALIFIYFSKENKFKLSLSFTLLTVFYIVIKIALSHAVVSKLNAFPIENEQKIDVAAFPDMRLPYNFKCVIETEHRFYIFDYNYLKRELFEMSSYEKNSNSEYLEYIETAKKSYVGDVFLKFARFPYYSVENNSDNILVKITDLRFRLDFKGRESFLVKILISKDMKVINESFNW